MGPSEVPPDTFLSYLRVMDEIVGMWRVLGSIRLASRPPVGLPRDEDVASSLAEYLLETGEAHAEPLDVLLERHGVAYAPDDRIDAHPQIRRALAHLSPARAQLTLLETLLLDDFPQHPALDNIHPVKGRRDTYLLDTPKTRIILKRTPRKDATTLLHLKTPPQNEAKNPEKAPERRETPENHPYSSILRRRPVATTTYEIMTLWAGLRHAVR